MVKQLILMRHAKSSWDAPHLDDHGRPLNARGRQSARALGNWLRHKGILPDEALISDAIRARETFAGLMMHCPVRLCQALYLADPSSIQAVLKTARGSTVLMIGHNPGIGHFAGLRVIDPPDHHRFLDYPTGATLIAEFQDLPWTAAVGKPAKTIAFTIPSELPEMKPA